MSMYCCFNHLHEIMMMKLNKILNLMDVIATASLQTTSSDCNLTEEVIVITILGNAL